jgi:glycosyltransferase involved in cell wall biosynthesis
MDGSRCGRDRSRRFVSMNPLTEPLNVAVVCITDPTSGGATSYEAGIVRHLEQIKDPCIQFTYYLPKNSSLVDSEVLPKQRIRKYRSGLREMFALSLRLSLPGFAILRRVGLRYGRLERDFRRQHISLAYFLAPNPLALDLVDTPMINTVWDLGHRDLPEFVEITGSRHFEERELFFRSVLPRSFRVVVETQHTARRISQFYGVDDHRICHLGLDVSTDSINTHSLPVRGDSPNTPYFLYPAQFWPHKRHILLIDAFAEVAKKNPDVKLVLTGGDKGNLQHVEDRVLSLGLNDRVDFLGFVSDEKLGELYNNARALVFPSSLGPSNLPPIEATRRGIPSLISNVHFDPTLNDPLITVVPEQTRDAWSTAMEQLLNNSNPPAPRVNTEPITSKASDLLRNLFIEFAEVRTEWPR